MDKTDVVIGGAGIIGLCAALELARSGIRVRVIERGRPMAEASWAAAGMLAAEDPENPPELAPIASLSRNLYPEFLRRVERLSGRSVPFRTRNTLQISRPGGSFHCSETSTRSSITVKEAEGRIPGLKAGRRSLLWLEEVSLDPRDLCTALPLAAATAGVALDEGAEILRVESQTGSVKITTSTGELSAGSFVNCCGAWSSTIRRLGPAPPDAVEPRKGQMLTVRVEGAHRLQHVLRTPTVYLVPRGDTRIVIGATVEQVGFDRTVQHAAMDTLLAQAADLWPPIASASVVESWTGLRPGTADDLPLIGSAGVPNCWWATGHFRNGILLAPATGLLIRQLLEGSSLAISLDAFSIKRFEGLAGSRVRNAANA